MFLQFQVYRTKNREKLKTSYCILQNTLDANEQQKTMSKKTSYSFLSNVIKTGLPTHFVIFIMCLCSLMHFFSREQ